MRKEELVGLTLTASNHYLFLTNASEVAQLIRDFLAAILSRSSR